MATVTAVEPGDHVDARIEATSDVVQLRHIPLSRIVVPDGFNPRGGVEDDRELEQMAESIRRDGILQPIRVRATDHGDFLLVAGERRYRAAVKACVVEMPAIIRPGGTGDEVEQSDLLVEALVENELRRGLDSLARARGYQRLMDTGLTIKGVAERLQTTQARVREHLRIFKLPEALQPKVATGEIPLHAIKTLAQLAAIHRQLAVSAAEQVLNPHDAYEPYTWADVERDPLRVALAGGELPDGVYRAHSSYPIEGFELGERARKDLATAERMLGRPVGHVQFDADDVERARALGAAHGESWQAIIVGKDVAAQLVGDYLARGVKELRKRLRDGEKRQAEEDTVATDSVMRGAGDQPSVPAGTRDERDREEARKAEREAERQGRARATAFNLELGRAIYTTVSRVRRVHENVLRILATVPIVTELADIAMRGARYGFPGWVTETTQKNGKTRYSYLEKPEAERRAVDYLLGAAKPVELAGRQIALLAMATYADQDAVATSNRSWHQIRPSGPWAHELDELLDQVVTDHLQDDALTLLAPALAQRKQQQGERSAARKARQETTARLDGIEERVAGMTVEQVEQAEQDLDTVWDRWTPKHTTIRQLLDDRRRQLVSPSPE